MKRDVIVGLDGSLLRLGVAVIDAQSLALIAGRTYKLDRRDAGWTQWQVADAIDHAAGDIDQFGDRVVAWYREEPWTHFPKAAKDAAYVCCAIDAEAGLTWREADTIQERRHPGGVKPNEWRAKAGLPAKASKQTCYERACELAGRRIIDDADPAMDPQDLADAYLIGRAGWILTEEGSEDAA